MSTVRVRLPESLHESARALAAKDNISLNQLITLALAEKVASLLTEEYLGKRARRGNRKKFLRAMAKVADVEPAEADRL